MKKVKIKAKNNKIFFVGFALLFALVGGLYLYVSHAETALKPPIKGLMFRDDLPPQDLVKKDGTLIFDNSVVLLRWKDLEPADGVFSTEAWNKINDFTSRGIRVRLRILAGIHAPDFVKQLGGPPVSGSGIDCSRSGGIAVLNTVDNVGGCVARFWTDQYLLQYEQLMQEIARRFDGTPEGALVLDVVDSACMTIYAEPFYRAHKSSDSHSRLYKAGLTELNDKYCHNQAIDIHNRVFRYTRTSIAFNNWEILTNSPTNEYRVSTTYGLQQAATFIAESRKKMGDKLVVQNNSLAEDPAEGCPTTALSINCYIKLFKQPKGFQTQTWIKLNSSPSTLYTALDNGLKVGASFAELPAMPNDAYGRPGIYNLNITKLRDYDRALEDNAR